MRKHLNCDRDLVKWVLLGSLVLSLTTATLVLRKRFHLNLLLSRMTPPALSLSILRRTLMQSKVLGLSSLCLTSKKGIQATATTKKKKSL
jgi:hypothetical protein